MSRILMKKKSVYFNFPISIVNIDNRPWLPFYLYDFCFRPPLLTAPGGAMYIHFTTDASVTKPGFRGTFSVNGNGQLEPGKNILNV